MYFRTFFKSLTAMLCLVFFTLQLQAAITVDNTSSNGVFNAAGVASLTIPHETNAGTNRALFVGVSTATTTLPVGVPTNRVAGVTYNGLTLTRVGTAISPNSLTTSEIFRLVNPPVGNFSVIITLAAVPVGGNAFVNYVVGGAISFQGVSQTSPNGAFVPASGVSDTPTATVTDSVAGDFVLDTLATLPSAVFAAAGAGQTEQWDGQSFFGSAFDIGAGSTKTAISATTTMNWLTASPANWALGAVTVKQSVTTAASVTISGRLTATNKRGVGNARVKMTDANGASRYATSNPFGYYRFENVGAGETYIFSVDSKRYSFNPQAVTVSEALTDLNFTAEQ